MFVTRIGRHPTSGLPASASASPPLAGPLAGRAVGSKYGPKFAKWVPAAGRARIIDKLAEPDLAPHTRALCFRLAEFPAMRRVWESFRGIGHEDFIIDAVIFRYETAISLPPPRPRKRTDFEEYLKNQNRIFPVSAEGIALKARLMLEEMHELQADAQFCWEWLWTGDRAMTFDKLVAAIEHTAAFYSNIAEERKKLIAAIALSPPPRKRVAKRAQEIWFSQLMSEWFATNVGRPVDAVVEILTDVAFDLGGELAPGIAKGRRRRSAGKHSRKKPE